TVAGTLSAGSSVHSNETVKTGGSGQAGLGFIDKTTLHVGPSSSVRLDKFVYDPNKGTGSVVIDATKGAFRFSTGAQDKGDVKIKTPQGTLGMRGEERSKSSTPATCSTMLIISGVGALTRSPPCLICALDCSDPPRFCQTRCAQPRPRFQHSQPRGVG